MFLTLIYFSGYKLVAYNFLLKVVADSFGYDCLPVILLIMVEGLSFTSFKFLVLRKL